MPMVELTDTELDLVTGGVGLDLTSGYGVVTAGTHGAEKQLQPPFAAGTVVPSQQRRATIIPVSSLTAYIPPDRALYGSGSPVGNVGAS